MQRFDGGRRLLNNVSSIIVGLALIVGAACSRKEAPQLQPAAAPPPPPTVPVARDAGADVVADAASDATDARPGGGKKWVGMPATGTGGVGLRVEGSLSRADGDKVVRAAQPKLRACADKAGAGGKGRVSFKLTVNDRGHVTLTEILSSSLPGGSEVEACMVNVLRDLSFPRSTGDSTLSFASTFGR